MNTFVSTFWGPVQKKVFPSIFLISNLLLILIIFIQINVTRALSLYSSWQGRKDSNLQDLFWREAVYR